MSDNQNEQSFNEDELKDIMDEIESLEEDYGEVEEEEVVAAAEESEEAPSEEVAEAEPVEEEPQQVEAAQQEPEPVVEEEPVVQEAAPAEEVDEDDDDSYDVEQILDDGDDDDDEDLETVAEPGEEAVAAKEDNVVELNKPVAQPATGDSAVQLNAQGQMNLAMNFEFNGAQSNIVLENGCVKINLPGVNVVFSEKDGCQIAADNGMTFQLPLDVKKAS